MQGFLFLCGALGLGLCVIDFFDSEKRIVWYARFWGAWTIGIVCLGFIQLVCAVATRSLFSAILAGIGVGILASAYKIFQWFRAKRLFVFARMVSIRKIPWMEYVFVLAVIVIFFISALQAMLFDQNGFPYGILKGWGDGAYHLDIIQHFAVSEPFNLTQPIAANLQLTYPFFVDFVSAILFHAGLPLAFAWHIPILIFGISMLCVLYALGKRMFKEKFFAWALVCITLFGGGLGFVWFARQVRLDAGRVGLPAQAGIVQSLVQNISHPKYEYTHLDIRTGGKLDAKAIDANIVWITPLISFFSHQRSFVLGAALGLLMLLGLWEYRCSRFGLRWLILLGLLPLIHTHTFIALGIFAFVWIMYAGSFNDAAYRKSVLLAVLLAFVIALPQIIFLYHGLFIQHQFYEYETSVGFTNISRQGFFTPWFGWMACTHNTSWLICDPNTAGTDSNVVWFWLKNFGFVFVGWVIALGYCIMRVIKKKPIDFGIRVLCITSFVLFALANLVKFQPWEFDNNKILFWWWVCAIMLSLYTLKALWQFQIFRPRQVSLWLTNFKFQINPRRKSTILNFILIIFVFFASCSGIIDVWGRVQSGLRLDKNTRNFGYYGLDEIAVANWISNNTNPNDVFVTHSQATQFIPMLSGRAIYLGFPGWLWTQGHAKVIFNRQQAIRNFVLTGNSEQLCADGVSYILDDSQFKKDYGVMSGAGAQLAYVYQGSSGEYRIYKLQCNSK